jgi:uncharacterized protein YjdB
MKASSLPNLKGKITNNNRVKIELTKAINQAIVYAKRAGVGYSETAQDVYDLFEAAKDAIRQWTRADSISVLPATDTMAAAETQQVTSITATYADSTTETISTSDPRVTYETSDATKATVSSTGLITAVATGSATITVTFQGRTDTVAVTVS